MPFFSSKRKSLRKKEESFDTTTASAASTSASATTASNKPLTSILRSAGSGASSHEKTREPPKVAFHCQLAHGSPTGIISGFNNVRDLYEKIATCFEIPMSSILFCTLNTHKIDMGKLLGAQIGLEDLIFAHVKGQAKEIEVNKSESTLGLTITDNGTGYAFIKRVKEGSVAERVGNRIKAGDHIEKINEKSVVGIRHFEVAQLLKDIPVGSTFKIRLIEPNAFDFPMEPAKRNRGKAGDVKSGTKTLRFKSDGKASIEDVDDTMVKGVERINGLLETYMGINDSDLAQQIWDLAQNKTNPSVFASAIDDSELGAFNFTDEFIFDLWAAIDDIKAGRVKEQEDQSERL